MRWLMQLTSEVVRFLYLDADMLSTWQSWFAAYYFSFTPINKTLCFNAKKILETAFDALDVLEKWKIVIAAYLINIMVDMTSI